MTLINKFLLNVHLKIQILNINDNAKYTTIIFYWTVTQNSGVTFIIEFCSTLSNSYYLLSVGNMSWEAYKQMHNSACHDYRTLTIFLFHKTNA